jgi:hypothetical protein
MIGVADPGQAETDLAGGMLTLWVPETRSALCDVLILVDQSAEPVVSSDGVDSGWGVSGEGP